MRKREVHRLSQSSVYVKPGGFFFQKPTYNNCEHSLLLQYLSNYFGLSASAFVQCWLYNSVGEVHKVILGPFLDGVISITLV